MNNISSHLIQTIVADEVITDSLIVNDVNISDTIDSINNLISLDNDDNTIVKFQPDKEIRFIVDDNYTVAISPNGLYVKYTFLNNTSPNVWFNVSEMIYFLQQENLLKTNSIELLQSQILVEIPALITSEIATAVLPINVAIMAREMAFNKEYPLYLKPKGLGELFDTLKLLYDVNQFELSTNNELKIKSTLSLNTLNVSTISNPNGDVVVIQEELNVWNKLRAYGAIDIEGSSTCHGNLLISSGFLNLWINSGIEFAYGYIFKHPTSGKILYENDALNIYGGGNALNTNDRLINLYETVSIKKDLSVLGSISTSGNINAVNNLQENSINLSSKYLLLSGGTLTGTLNGTTINAVNNLQENSINLSSKYLLLTGGTLTGTLNGTTINAINNLQENSINLSSKYLLLAGGTLTGTLNGTIINAVNNLQENSINLSSKYLTLTGGTLTGTLNGTIINAVNNLQENGTNLISKYLTLTGGTITGTLNINKGTTSAPTTGTTGGTGDRIILYQGGTSVYPYSIGINANNFWFSAPNNSYYNWYINGNEKVRISTAGNVGINTNDPKYTLDINGTTLHRNGNGAGSYTNNQLIFSYNATNTYMHSIKTRHNASADNYDNAIDFYVWKSTDATTAIGTKQIMSITSGGVGIGITNPSQALQVSGNIQASGTINAITNLQENSVNLTSKYLQLTGGTINGAITFNANITLADTLKINCYDNNHFIYFNRANNILQIQEYGDINFTIGTAQTQILNISSTGLKASGSTNHSFKVNGTEYLKIDGTTTTISNNLSVSGSTTLNGAIICSKIKKRVSVPQLPSYLGSGYYYYYINLSSYVDWYPDVYFYPNNRNRAVTLIVYSYDTAYNDYQFSSTYKADLFLSYVNNNWVNRLYQIYNDGNNFSCVVVSDSYIEFRTLRNSSLFVNIEINHY